MLHELLKLVIYLSILRTTTSSGYLTEDSVVNFRRASPSSISGEPSSRLSSDGEGYEWAELSNAEPAPAQLPSDYFMPKIVNVNNMLYTQLNNDNSRIPKRSSNNRKLNQRVRGKKDNNNKLINSKNNKLANLIKSYDNLSKSSYNNESNAVKNATASVQTSEDEQKVNLTSNTEEVLDAPARRPSPFTNEYPINQISSSTQQDRELQQLFGIEGAKKYQNYQLQQQQQAQQLVNENEQFPPAPEDEGVELKEPATKRSGGLNGEEMQDVSGAMVNQIMPRATRRQREYDVPLIRE